MTAKPVAGSAGSSVSIALRPEMLSMGEGGGTDVLRGSVEDVTFLGAVVRIRVRIGDGGPVVSVDTFNDPNLSVPTHGETVAVSFPKEAVLVLETAPVQTTETLIAEG